MSKDGPQRDRSSESKQKKWRPQNLLLRPALSLETSNGPSTVFFVLQSSSSRSMGAKLSPVNTHQKPIVSIRILWPSSTSSCQHRRMTKTGISSLSFAEIASNTSRSFSMTPCNRRPSPVSWPCGKCYKRTSSPFPKSSNHHPRYHANPLAKSINSSKFAISPSCTERSTNNNNLPPQPPRHPHQLRVHPFPHPSQSSHHYTLRRSSSPSDSSLSTTRSAPSPIPFSLT